MCLSQYCMRDSFIYLLAGTERAANGASNRATAPNVASTANADIASSAATLGESWLLNWGGCGKGSSNEGKEDGGGLHFDSGMVDW
ncbi:hypothetical protein CFAM422_003174 [Trichoderma lentiforme]|uniref:Uncharacterized protein n=1 Tax=Trichoderma lentiforme TaxID=1567552 RepID=A0A9P5CHN2_9HYPO|nr:hypothetical protein CFAM422_003174 [Trichoderma lentiforme]